MKKLNSKQTVKCRVPDAAHENSHYMHRTRSLCSDNGFSLIEVLIALVVLLVGMLGVMGMQYYAITGNTTSRETRIATNLSQQLIEQIKSTPYTQLSSLTTPEQPFSGVTEMSITGGLTGITRVWWVLNDCVSMILTSDDGTCNPALAAVCCLDPDGSRAVDVSAIRGRTCWTDKNGANHSMTFNAVRWDENAVP